METAILGQSLARTLLAPDFRLSRFAGRQLDFPSGIKGKRSSAFWSQLVGLSRLAGRQLKGPSGIKGKQPFLAKSWPKPFGPSF